MKRILCFVLLFALIFSALALPLTAAEAEKKEKLTFTGIVSSAADADGDGFIDVGGEVRVRIFTGGAAGSVTLSFSEAELADMAGAESGSLGVLAGTVMKLDYYGYASLTSKDYFTESDLEKVKGGFLAAAIKNEGGSAFLLPFEVYSTRAEQKSLSVSYDGEGGAKLFYDGEEYTVLKKPAGGNKNEIFITERGNAFPLSELESKIPNPAEGEMTAHLTDADGDGLFDFMDIKSRAEYAPLSAEWNAPAGVRGAALSYVLFDAEARISAPYGRTFSARHKDGAGLSVLVASDKGELLFSAEALCYDGSRKEYVPFTAVRNGKITAAENSGGHVKVTFESGETALLPSPEALAGEIEAEIFFRMEEAVGSKTVNINSAECPWFGTLAQIYAEGGAEALAGKTATAVFAADGTAVYADITE